MEQAAIRHGPRRGADILRQLRPHKDNNRAWVTRLKRCPAVSSSHNLNVP
ncbi:Hypothetical protein GbCGDNIH9_8719 [Granulibacter bethesdensis]|uniref:Uncharacterized protein n=1 Tax=Granulibacter bethesdensis TaxID=364410 RepID=A0AAC9KBT3_9PROT|nr:Hypothetical protein GbCGDNIH9_8719 [Granulibacter bethesdensis]APH62003.1 Hypothetical protein GbCGDNIH8_8719 [Granulibacter bethesdensis]